MIKPVLSRVRRAATTNAAQVPLTEMRRGVTGRLEILANRPLITIQDRESGVVTPTANQKRPGSGPRLSRSERKGEGDDRSEPVEQRKASEFKIFATEFRLFTVWATNNVPSGLNEAPETLPGKLSFGKVRCRDSSVQARALPLSNFTPDPLLKIVCSSCSIDLGSVSDLMDEIKDEENAWPSWIGFPVRVLHERTFKSSSVTVNRRSPSRLIVMSGASG